MRTVTFLFIFNTFMTFAWYGHLKFKEYDWGKNLSLIAIILISWGLAFFEYLFQVPANEGGFKENGGPFTLVELKTIQEAVTLHCIYDIHNPAFQKRKTGLESFGRFRAYCAGSICYF